MKITFIGSSHGSPEAHRRCSCAMVDIRGSLYFIDMGTLAMEWLLTRGISPNNVKGVFVTHMHGDHTHGLFQFIDLLTLRYPNATPTICLPNIDAVPIIHNWLNINLTVQKQMVAYHEVVSGVVFEDGVLKVTAIPTQHCPKSFAYLLEAEGKRVLFSGDIKHPSIDFPVIDGTIDLAICECAHFPATDYLPILDMSQIKQLCINHYSKLRTPSIYELADKLPLTMATDDLEIIV